MSQEVNVLVMMGGVPIPFKVAAPPPPSIAVSYVSASDVGRPAEVQ